MARAKAPKSKRIDAAPAAAAPDAPDAAVLADLEARLADDLDDLDAWLVYADALQKRGDPHGELIVLQIAADKDPQASKTPARAAFKRAFAARAPKLLRNLAGLRPDEKNPYAAPLIWRTGFPRRLELEGEVRVANLGPRLAQALTDPALRLLGEISLKLYAEADVEGVFAALAAHVPPGLIDLELRTERSLTASTVIWKHCPRLQRLTLIGERLELAGIELPLARRVSLQSQWFTAAAMQAVAAAPWPELERLDLRVGTYGAFDLDPSVDHSLIEYEQTGATFEDIAPLLRRTDLPALTHLKIRSAPFAGAVLRELAERPLGRQLEVLDLSKGTLTPQDIFHAADRKQNFPKLRELWAPSLDQWNGVAAAVASLAKHVITKPSFDVLGR